MEERVPHKVLKILTKDAQDTLRHGDNVKIGIFKEDEIKTVKIRGGRCTHSPRRVGRSYFI